nr:P-type DNA transfer ATPase VirB11 [uncultured Rhodopila sp.]
MSEQDTINQLAAIMQPLNRWGATPGVEEIAINEPGVAFIRQDGAWSRHEVDLDFDDCYDITVLAAALRRQTVGDNAPLVGADIPFGSGIQRLQAVLPPAVPGGTVSLTIRRFESRVSPVSKITERYDTSRWNQWEKRNEARKADFAEVLAVFDAGDIEAFLDICVRMHLNILLCGATGSGKTTLARSMTALVDMTERILTIEDALELVVPHPNCVRLLYSKGGLDSSGVKIADLLQASLRMRPSRIILQELRDKESAYTFVTEALTGHPGCITTLHGGSAAEAFKWMFTLIKGSNEGGAYSRDDVVSLMTAAIDVIIPLANFGSQYAIREVWFAADAARRGETAANLMGD